MMCNVTIPNYRVSTHMFRRVLQNRCCYYLPSSDANKGPCLFIDRFHRGIRLAQFIFALGLA